jgi:hypothetical protein
MFGNILELALARPVSQNAYRFHRLLKKRGPRKLNEIEFLLPRQLQPSSEAGTDQPCNGAVRSEAQATTMDFEVREVAVLRVAKYVR